MMTEYTIKDARALVNNKIPASSPDTRENIAKRVMQKVREGEGAERALMQIRGV